MSKAAKAVESDEVLSKTKKIVKSINDKVNVDYRLQSNLGTPRYH